MNFYIRYNEISTNSPVEFANLVFEHAITMGERHEEHNYNGQQ
jgi:hypothetical protein